MDEYQETPEDSDIDFAAFAMDGGGQETDPAVAMCAAMFNRVLASWASDLLHLRREGLAAPGWREQVHEEDGIAWRRDA